MEWRAIIKQKLSLITIILSLIAGFGTATYFYYQYQKVQQQLTNPSLFTKEETRRLVEQVSRLIELPDNEEPTIATISDIEKLKNQPFFAKAKMGDKVLIYTNAKKAILYDPVANKIIEVAPVNIGSNNTSSPSATQQIISPVRVVLYNGTDITGLTRTVEQTLKDTLRNVDVILKDSAVKKDYTKTLVVDLAGNKKEEAAAIAQALKGELTTLPLGEEKPASVSGKTAEILVIVGKDYNK